MNNEDVSFPVSVMVAVLGQQSSAAPTVSSISWRAPCQASPGTGQLPGCLAWLPSLAA
jgi:hypothetical protein